MYKVGKQTFLWYEGIENNEFLKTYEKLLPTDLLKGNFSKHNSDLADKEEYLNNTFYTKTFAIDAKDEDSKQFAKFKSMINEGEIDKKAFINGEEVILMIPMYYPGNENVELSPFPKKKVIDATNEDNRMKWLFETSGAYELSYNPRYKDYYKKQDRNRIGILQSMGVTREKFSHHYLKTGVLVGLLSLIMIHLILFLILFFTSLGDLAEFSVGFTGYMEDIFTYKLMDYPWVLHLIVCIIYFIITVLIYYMPSRRITSKYPVENIRSLSR